MCIRDRVGHQYKGAIINSWTDADLSGTVASGDLAEVGGLVGLNNRGLVANCYSFSNIYGSGNRDNGNEGMAVVSTLVAVQAEMCIRDRAYPTYRQRRQDTCAFSADRHSYGQNKLH